MRFVLAGEGLLPGAFAIFAMGDDKPSADPAETLAIDRALAGDTDAFDFLVRQWSRRVTSLAWTVTASRDAAEEIAQETFVRAFETLRRFRKGSAFGPWVLRIAANLSIDHVRRTKRFDSIETVAERSGSRTEAPDVRAEASETAGRIARTIAALPEMQRVVAQLFLVEEYDHAEIAAMTGLAQGTVRSHLSIARAKLREALEENGS